MPEGHLTLRAIGPKANCDLRKLAEGQLAYCIKILGPSASQDFYA